MPIILGTAAAVALLLWIVLRGVASGPAHAQTLRRLGFAPCPAEANRLEESIAWMNQNPGYRFEVADPWRVSLAGESVYFLRRRRRRASDRNVVEELLLPLRRPSEQGLLLFIKPGALSHGAMTKLIGNVATGSWDAQPGDLKKIQIPGELQETNLLGALGPSGSTLFELIDRQALNLLLQVGDLGILMALCRGERCSLIAPSTRIPLKLIELRPILLRLATLSPEVVPAPRTQETHRPERPQTPVH